MEYSLRRFNFITLSKNIVVLILILMEYSLRHQITNNYGIKQKCLNPYSNGI